jgi:hypothetical protein
VDQVRESVHHDVITRHDTNICGDLATFTFDVTSHTHVLDNGNTFLFDDHESFTYTLVFDDPALGTWTAHGAENFHAVVTHGGEVFENTFNSKEGPIQIIQHVVFTPTRTATSESTGRSRRSATAEAHRGYSRDPARTAPRYGDLVCTNAPGRNRTCDLALRRRALYPLSYRRSEGQSSRGGRLRRPPPTSGLG